MTSTTKALTHYFRQSLVDSERISPCDKDLLPALGVSKKSKDSQADSYIAIDRQAWLTGQIDGRLAESIIESQQPIKRSPNQAPSNPPLQSVDLVLFPRADLLITQRGAKNTRKRAVLLPLVVFVVLQRDGTLLPSSNAPWIPREWMAPNQSSSQPFCDFTVVDAFFTDNPFEGIEEWPDLVDYSTRLLGAALGITIPECQPGKTEGEAGNKLSIFDFDIHGDYSCTEQALLQTELMVVGAKTKIISVLDCLIDLETSDIPPLYERFCSTSNTSLASYKDRQKVASLSRMHIGQMTGEFPFSPKQRNALHHLSLTGQTEGDILAVNGPPGTGKTTLLRSVVANLWSQAALDESEPPLIVATSNNNQAVTNILESFARINEQGIHEHLEGRWLPEVNSYGLYCCAKSKAKETNPYRYLGPGGEGCMIEWHTQKYLDTATSLFMESAQRWHGDPLASLSSARNTLHDSLKNTQKAIERGVDLDADLDREETALRATYGSFQALTEQLAESEVSLSQYESEQKIVKQRLDAFYNLLESRSLWVRLLLWLPPVRKQETRRIRRLLNEWQVSLDDHSDEFVETWLANLNKQARNEANRTRQQVAKLINDSNRYKQAELKLKAWIKLHGQPKHLTSEDKLEKIVEEINDNVLRFKLFKLATHYWEARWLIETRQFLENNESDKKSPIKTLRKLHRFAKLTPCFVSTFYMVPSTFMAGEYQDDVWKNVPLFNEIDLLIIDEAGQALPEVSAASFSLAKRALVVGDTDQIEPVWSVSAGIDRSNLETFGLLKSEQHYADFWLQSGLLASSGNVMRIAQRQCTWHQFTALQKGLYLTEHRRCFDPIIQYCNTLVYDGVLEPLRGEPTSSVPWGMLVLIPTREPSRSYGGSRGNPREAQIISEWLSSEKDTILQYARQTNPQWQDVDDAKVLKLAVGIITPFSKQAMLIRQALNNVGIEGLTVGTVHSLQGDERLIVLFSSVYGENDKDSGKFYDRGHNMMNVAVSRAKDAFIVFGDPTVFGATEKGSPSGILRTMINQQSR